MSQSFSSCQLHFLNNKVSVLTFTFIWANSSDDNLLIFFLSFFSRKLALTFHAIQGDSLHEIRKPFSSEKKKKNAKNVLNCRLLKVLLII